MNWFDTSGLTSLAKSALKEAQKTIDKALDIQDDSGDEQEPVDEPATSHTKENTDSSDFFASWGLTASGESEKESPVKNVVVTESPSKATTQTLWGSFAGSFFEQAKSNDKDGTIVRPPKAKSMNLISDSKYDSQDDLFSKSQLVMSDGPDIFDSPKPSREEEVKGEDRRNSNKSNRLSLVSSHNSSESVEVLSHSVKTTPDSEGASVHTASHSSSAGQRINSESVEILPDSLVSPSSIECLGFDSYTSDKNSDTSTSPGDFSDKKSTPFGDMTEKAATADSVSLVADDEEDTMSYNSISECTAPTILGPEDKASNDHLKVVRTEPKKTLDKEFINLELPVTQRMQLSENSSNDGSWSDRTLHADGDSLTLESNTGETNKEDQDDIFMERLSDSSSFYNVNVTKDQFANNEKQQYADNESSSGNVKDSSRRPSPVSSDSKSDLVKIGSDRTSGHTSGDEVETATSSDIEIIPSPNGENGNGYYRHSPAKVACQKKFDGTTSPNLVDLVLGKTLATKIRGHNRELSEASVQSNASDESQGSDNDRLMRRLCEMAEILEARENRLMEVSRCNAELAESNADLKAQLDATLSRPDSGDVNVITDDYTQRLSALEKKFQQAIRDKDQLRKQLDNLKSETAAKSRSELENQLKERDDMITQLQDEGEKLARQQLQQSNIIKKLRAKERENEQVIKSLRDKLADQSGELERVRRSVAAKEEAEAARIEAVYRLTAANRKLDADLLDTKSVLEDTTQRLESHRASLEAARRELSELQRSKAALEARRDDGAALRDRCAALARDNERLRAALDQLRAQHQEAAARHEARAAVLRAEVAALQAAPDAALAAALHQHRALAPSGAAVRRHAETELRLAKSLERERLLHEELQQARGELQRRQQRLLQLEEQQRLQRQVEEEKKECAQCGLLGDNLRLLTERCAQVESEKGASERQIAELRERVREIEEALEGERAALDTERKRNAILQERLSSQLELPPPGAAATSHDAVTSPWGAAGGAGGARAESPHSMHSDSASQGFWLPEEAGWGAGGPAAGWGAGGPAAGWGAGGPAAGWGVEGVLAAAARREGELRAAREQAAVLRRERDALRETLAAAAADEDARRSLQEQYDALLQMYGEKEEQLQELALDLRDLTNLYKAQMHELLALRGH